MPELEQTTEADEPRVLRIASWNCAGGLRDKIERALSFEADITVVQEAADPRHHSHALPVGSEWFSHIASYTNKGIFVWARPGWSVEPHTEWVEDPGFNQVVPLVVAPPDSDPLTIWAVWTHHAKRYEDAYVGQVHRALDHYDHLLGARTILIGDFNSNAIWDSTRRRNHTTLAERLAERGIRSAYHQHTGEALGAETMPTQWQTRNEAMPFHLDYAFVSDDLEVKDVWIGSYAEWCRKKIDGGVSDHAPLVVTLAERGR